MPDERSRPVTVPARVVTSGADDSGPWVVVEPAPDSGPEQVVLHGGPCDGAAYGVAPGVSHLNVPDLDPRPGADGPPPYRGFRQATYARTAETDAPGRAVFRPA